MTDGDAIPRGRRSALPIVAGVALLLAVAGGAILLLKGDPPLRVTAIRVSPKPGIDFSGVIPRFDTPDLYTEVVTRSGPVRSEVRKDTVIGSGLSMGLPREVKLSEITELKIWDKNPISDTEYDRCDRPAAACDGAKFHIECLGVQDASKLRRVGWALLAVGGVEVIGTLIALVRRQAIAAPGTTAA